MMENNLPKILCVDDELGILESLERTLRRRFEVLLATDTIDAFAILEQNPDISVVISDHILGTENGVEFLSKVEKAAPSCGRVLLSGQIDLKSMEDAINTAKVHKFIMKPWENDQLLIQVVEAYKFHKSLMESQRLQKLAITDPVTQLTNHRFFQERIRIEFDRHKDKKRALSLIMIDIDHFKKFNDRFGHPEGDKLLAQVAEELKNNCPEGDSISRYGGEEFAVILPNTTSEEALMVAERMRNHVLNCSFNNYPLSISLGIASYPQHADSVDELIISADQSLYQAKRRGRNQTVVGLNFDH